MTSSNPSRSRIAARLAVAGIVGGTSLFFASCRTPQSLCEEWYTEVFATGVACSTLDDTELDRAIGPVDPMNPTRRGCGIVSSVSDPSELVNDCFPILRNLQDFCGAGTINDEPDYLPFVEDFPENLPSACSAGHFETIR